MFSIFNTFSDSSSGIGALGVNGGEFLIQLLSFLIVFLLLKKFAFKPIIKVMKERRQSIEDGVKLGEDMRRKNEELAAQVEEKLHSARAEADNIISSAQASARQLVQEAEESAREKVESISAEAQARIKLEAAQARKELEKEIVNLVAEATEVIIDEKVDAKKDASLIDKALKGQTS